LEFDLRLLATDPKANLARTDICQRRSNAVVVPADIAGCLRRAYRSRSRFGDEKRGKGRGSESSKNDDGRAHFFWVELVRDGFFDQRVCWEERVI